MCIPPTGFWLKPRGKPALPRFEKTWLAASHSVNNSYTALAQSDVLAASMPPHLFVWQINLETGFNPNAQSPAGAERIAHQFMPATATPHSRERQGSAMQTMIRSPPLSEVRQHAATAITAPTSTIGTTIWLFHPETDDTNNYHPVPSHCITPQHTYLQRLPCVQAVCENQSRQPNFLSIADAQLALHGLERYVVDRSSS